MWSRLAPTLVGVLVAFHAWLLVGQAWEGQLAEPGLVLRWLAAVGLFCGLAVVRRRGGALFRGRRAVSLWLLAALLHGPAALRSDVVQASPALPEAVVTLVQAVAVPLVLGVTLALLALWRRRGCDRRSVAWFFRRVSPVLAAVAVGPFALAPRPPPVRLPA